jgi:hypothetical protein
LRQNVATSTVPPQSTIWRPARANCSLSVGWNVGKTESVHGKVTGAFIGTVCTRQKLVFRKAVTVCMTLECILLAPRRRPPKVAGTVTKLTLRCSVCSNKMLITRRGTLY